MWGCKVNIDSCDTYDNKTTVKFTVTKVEHGEDRTNNKPIKYVSFFVKGTDIVSQNKDVVNAIDMTNVVDGMDKTNVTSFSFPIQDHDIDLNGSSMMDDPTYTNDYYVRSSDSNSGSNKDDSKVRPYVVKWTNHIPRSDGNNKSKTYLVTIRGDIKIREKYWVAVQIDNCHHITQLTFDPDQDTGLNTKLSSSDCIDTNGSFDIYDARCLPTFNCDYTTTINCDLNSIIKNRNISLAKSSSEKSSESSSKSSSVSSSELSAEYDLSQFTLKPGSIADILSNNVHKLEYTKNSDKIIIDEYTNINDDNDNNDDNVDNVDSRLILHSNSKNSNVDKQFNKKKDGQFNPKEDGHDLCRYSNTILDYDKNILNKCSIFDRLIRIVLDRNFGKFGSVVKNHYTCLEPKYYFTTKAIVETLFDRQRQTHASILESELELKMNEHKYSNEHKCSIEHEYTDVYHKRMTECIEKITSPDNLGKFVKTWMNNYIKKIDPMIMKDDTKIEIDLGDSAFVYYFKYRYKFNDKLDIVTICVVLQNILEKH
jgi:hypothetical protein